MVESAIAQVERQDTSVGKDGTPVLRYHLLDTGYCLAFERVMMQGGALRQVRCHSTVALLQHPGHGWFLLDTGYAPRMLEATRRLPYRLYRLATPLRLRPELAVVAQLPHFGLSPGDIGTVVISHFHADHIAGLRDFPAATPSNCSTSTWGSRSGRWCRTCLSAATAFPPPSRWRWPKGCRQGG